MLWFHNFSWLELSCSTSVWIPKQDSRVVFIEFLLFEECYCVGWGCFLLLILCVHRLWRMTSKLWEMVSKRKITMSCSSLIQWIAILTYLMLCLPNYDRWFLFLLNDFSFSYIKALLIITHNSMNVVHVYLSWHWMFFPINIEDASILCGLDLWFVMNFIFSGS